MHDVVLDNVIVDKFQIRVNFIVDQYSIVALCIILLLVLVKVDLFLLVL